jgi:hypothetical protein
MCGSQRDGQRRCAAPCACLRQFLILPPRPVDGRCRPGQVGWRKFAMGQAAWMAAGCGSRPPLLSRTPDVLVAELFPKIN